MKFFGSLFALITISSICFIGVLVLRVEPIYLDVESGWKCTAKRMPANYCVRYERG